MKKLRLLPLLLCILLPCLTGCGENPYAQQFKTPSKSDTVVVLHTSMGDISAVLFEDVAPKACENFLTHAEEGYYDGITFHRVIEDFMIQSGDPTGTGYGGESIWGDTFDDEISEYYSTYYGALCMANTGDADTNGSQFFIVTDSDTSISKAETANESASDSLKVAEEKLAMFEKYGGAIWLDYDVSRVYNEVYDSTIAQHTVFGQVLDGMDVAIEISQVETYSELEVTDATIDDPDQTDIVENKPKEDVTIDSIEILTYKEYLELYGED